MPQVIQNAEEQHNIESPEPLRGEFIDIEREVLDLRSDQAFGFQKRVELDAIDGHDAGAPALAFEAEPAVPGADIENALTSQIAWKPEHIEAPPEMLDGLKSR